MQPVRDTPRRILHAGSFCERANVTEQRHSHEYYSTPLSRHSQVVSALITFSEADKRIHDQHDEQAREAANQR